MRSQTLFLSAALVLIAGAVIYAGKQALQSYTGQASGSAHTPSAVTADAPLPAAQTAPKLDNPAAPLPSNHPAFNPAELTRTEILGKKVRFTQFRVGNRNVKALLPEGDVVWVGSSGGVIRYETTTDSYRQFNNRNGLLANGVFSLGRLNGQLAVGTYGGGMALYDELLDTFRIVNVPEGLADAFVYDVLQLKNGDIWIATWSGANRIIGGDLFDPAAWETYTVRNTDGGLPNDWVYGLAKGKNGEIWMATEGGLARFKDGKWDHWTHEDGQGAPYDLVKDDNQFSTDPASMSSHHARQKQEMNLQNVTTAYNPNYIVALEVDADGTVWAGTWGGGLAHFDGEKWTNMTVKDGLPSNHIFMLHRDFANRLWVGTSAGIAVLGDDRQTILDIVKRQDGLYSDVVFSMASEAPDTLWIGSFGGVTRYVFED